MCHGVSSRSVTQLTRSWKAAHAGLSVCHTSTSQRKVAPQEAREVTPDRLVGVSTLL